MENNKVLIIGLDGATLDCILPWVKEGKLPNIARLMEDGCYGKLKSTPEKISPAAWTSFATGLNPGKHGIHHFYRLDLGTFQVKMNNATHRDGDPVWSYLSKAGKRVCVINVPATYPCDYVNGYMVSGWDAPSIQSEGFTHPPQLIHEIINKFKHYPLTPSIKKYKRSQPDRVIKDIHRVLDLRASVSKYLLQKDDWDLFMTVFTATDEAQHHFWHLLDKNHSGFDPAQAAKYGNTILEVYQKCDTIIGDIIRLLGDDATIIIMSDHGAAANSLGELYLPQWLQQIGFAVKRNGTIKSLSFWKLRGAVYKLLYSLVGYTVRQYLKKVIGWNKSGFDIRVNPDLSAYDWSRTKVYALGPNLMVNRKGRECHGIVSPGEEYEQIRNQVIAKLNESRDIKTGRKIVKEVLKREDVYHSKYVEYAPDLIVNWAEDVVISGILCPDMQGKPVSIPDIDFTRAEWSGEHSDYGIFFAKGPHMRPGDEVENAEIIDIAPSLLYLMGFPIPEDMDGKVLTNIFSENFLRSHPIKYTKAEDSIKEIKGKDYSEEEAKKVKEHLKNLGYL